MPTTLTENEINSIINATCHDPFSILGMHKKKKDDNDVISVRVFFPDAKIIKIVGNNNTVKAEQIHTGLFEAIFERDSFFPYRINITYNGIDWLTYDDAYRLPPVLSDVDLYLFSEGTNIKAYTSLGAHIRVLESIKGTFFAVWAPNAKRVSIVGDFNHWDGRRNIMRSRGESGIWELFIPELKDECLYKYEILSNNNTLTIRTDPYGFYTETRPKTASVIYDHNKYNWNDKKWIENKKELLDKPLVIYEIHLGSWRKKNNNEFLNYREIAKHLIPYLLEMGYNFVEFLPIAEHPLDDSWGYQVTGFFAPTSRFGKPDDLKYLIDELHKANIGVILDWVPAHFPKDTFALAKFDTTALYEHADPKKGEHTDWGTLIFNYGRNEIRTFLISNAIYWLDKFHIDGLRVDAVASMLYLDYSRNEGEWIPNQYGGRENIEAIDFIKKLNEEVYTNFPHTLMIAEESTSWPMVSKPTYLGGLGFGFKWNMGWMNDFLSYMSKDPVYKKYHRNNLTFSMIYAFTENFILPISHDEVVHGKGSMISKMPGDYWQKFANLRLAYGYMFSHPGKKLLFMDCDIAQWEEWNFRESLDWHLLDFPAHRKFNSYIKELIKIYKSEKALWEVDNNFQGFSWIDFHDSDNSIISFIRWSKEKKEHIVIVCNFTPVIRHNYRIGVPFKDYYKEILNSDSEYFYGSNVGNFGHIKSEDSSWHLYPHSVNLTIPPLSILMLKPTKGSGLSLRTSN